MYPWWPQSPIPQGHSRLRHNYTSIDRIAHHNKKGGQLLAPQHTDFIDTILSDNVLFSLPPHRHLQALVLFLLGCLLMLHCIVLRMSHDKAKIEQLQDEAKTKGLLLKQKEVRSWPHA
eukprot:6868875-Pyramimonas_sp.AAC.3